jgi:2-polyprenyl-3-methyl-5-hydroxy-6-metoxy-1,4-benzoquinol methylase
VTSLVPPTLPELRALREDGMKVGYRGIHIYLRFLAILEVLAGLSPENVLSLGCGFGIFDRLLPKDVSLLGIDASEAEIAYARAWAEAHGRRYRYERADILIADFPERGFDLVILSEVIEHVPEDRVAAILARAIAALRPGGHLLLSVPNRLTLRNRARALLLLPPVLMDKTHLREYTKDEADALVARLPLRTVAARAAVLYFPQEPVVARVLPAEAPLRRRIVAGWPGAASHFIYLLRREESS